MMDLPLATAFVRAASRESDVMCSSLERLEAVLELVVSTARKDWPSITLSAEDFVVFLASRLSMSAGFEKAINKLCLSDLWLVFGCVKENPFAIAAVADQIERTGHVVGRRMQLYQEDQDDLIQRLRERLLVRDASGEFHTLL